MDETGISKPRVSAKGKDLPTTRHISAVHHHDMGYHDHAVTVFLISWGQAIDHDMTFTADTKGFLSSSSSFDYYLMMTDPFSLIKIPPEKLKRSRNGHGPTLLRHRREQTKRGMLSGRNPVWRSFLRFIPSTLHGICSLGFLTQRRMQIR